MLAGRVAILAALLAWEPLAGAGAQSAAAPWLQTPGLFARELRGAIATTMPAPGYPVSILPESMARTVAQTASGLAVPKPRLRPTAPHGASTLLALQPDSPLAIDRTATAAIGPSSSVAPAALEPPPPPAPAAPAAVHPADPPTEGTTSTPPGPERRPTSEDDRLLGDPARIYSPPLQAKPQAPQPQGIPLPRSDWQVPAAGAAASPAVAKEPYQRVRELQALQDRLAQGSVESLEAQRALIAATDQAFDAADPNAWADSRNAVAAVAFVLSGGPPTILKKLSVLDPKPPIDERLVNGVLAYTEGREAEALSLLGQLDAIDLPPSIAAHVAMARSALVVRTDPEATTHLLSLARLLAPGTLVEEAAIRRQIFVANQLRDDQAVQSLARQYLDRFRHSVYAGNFRERFAVALSHMDFVNDPAQFGRLDDMLASVEPEGRAELYLSVALAGAVTGRTNATNLASTRVIALTASTSPMHTRARLYRAGALVASAKTFEAARNDYTSVDRKVLSPSDQALFDAIGEAIAAVRSGTEISLKPATVAVPTEADQPSTLMARATATLKTVDALLAGK